MRDPCNKDHACGSPHCPRAVALGKSMKLGRAMFVPGCRAVGKGSGQARAGPVGFVGAV